jgi:hypothetical protein
MILKKEWMPAGAPSSSPSLGLVLSISHFVWRQPAQANGKSCTRTFNLQKFRTFVFKMSRNLIANHMPLNQIVEVRVHDYEYRLCADGRELIIVHVLCSLINGFPPKPRSLVNTGGTDHQKSFLKGEILCLLRSVVAASTNLTSKPASPASKPRDGYVRGEEKLLIFYKDYSLRIWATVVCTDCS